MALVTCPECGRNISDKAESCPGCGYPLKKLAEANRNFEVSRTNISDETENNEINNPSREFINTITESSQSDNLSSLPMKNNSYASAFFQLLEYYSCFYFY